MCLFLFKVQRLLSELLARKNSALLKYAGHLVFLNCQPAAILSEKYTGYSVFVRIVDRQKLLLFASPYI